MTVKTSHKVSLFVLLFVTAVVLCTLPFILSSFNDIYVFTKNKYPSSEESNILPKTISTLKATFPPFLTVIGLFDKIS